LSEQIAMSTAMLSELLDSLLDISRLDVVGVKPEIRVFPLGPLFERLADSNRRAAVDRNLTLRFRPTALWVESDPVMIERIIANLVSNALRYTPPGGRILIAARQRGEDVLIEVRDSGMGIAPEHQAAIFAEFYQIGNEAREHNKGLGLGLSIVDRLARALNVGVSLNSRLGAGTTFSLRLRGGRPMHGQPVEQVPATLGKVHCIGNSEALFECIRLAEHWNYAVSHSDGADNTPAPRNCIIICEMALAEAISHELPASTPLIVLSSGENQHIPPGAHALPQPVRPARLRALLGQLQKTLSKSTP
jgi:anti-sigma regulatory factor (Ser/Thr protein kinase)